MAIEVYAEGDGAGGAWSPEGGSESGTGEVIAVEPVAPLHIEIRSSEVVLMASVLRSEEEETAGVSRGLVGGAAELEKEADVANAEWTRLSPVAPLAMRTARRAVAPISRKTAASMASRLGRCFAILQRCQVVATLCRLSVVGRIPFLISTGEVPILMVAAPYAS